MARTPSQSVAAIKAGGPNPFEQAETRDTRPPGGGRDHAQCVVPWNEQAHQAGKGVLVQGLDEDRRGDERHKDVFPDQHGGRQQMEIGENVDHHVMRCAGPGSVEPRPGRR